MPQEQQYQFVRLPNGEYGKFRADATDAVIREAILKDFPDAFGESTLKKVGRGTAIGAFAGAGIPETMTPLEDLVKGMKEQAKNIPWYDPTGGAITQAVGIAKNVGSTGRDVLKDVTSGTSLKKRTIGFGIDDPEKTAHDVSSLLTQLLLLKGGKKAAETPLGEGVGTKAVRKTVRAIADRSVEDVNRVEAKATAEAAEKSAAHKDQVSLARVKARADYEAAEAKKTAEYEADRTAAKAKHEAGMEAAQMSLEGRITKEAHTRLRNERYLKAEKKLAAARNEAADGLRKNLDKAEAAEGASLDQRYEDFRQKILGVSEAAPNGTLQSELTPVGDAVFNARKNILKGSKTNIPIFNDILGRLKDMIETPEGELKPVSGQMISTDQLRGYQKEISSAIYEKSLPGDVKRALGSVLESIQAEVSQSIQDVHGSTAVGIYEKLSKDWTDYKRIWFDTSTVNPLPRIREMLRDPTVMQEGIPITERIAKGVKGEKGQSIVRLLAEKMKFGADPMLAAKLMALDRKLAGLESFYEKIPVAKYPRFPKLEEPKPPEPTTSAKYDLPKPPDIEPFNRKEYIAGGVEKRMRSAANWGSGIGVLRLINDVVTGNPGGAAHVGETIAMMQAMKKLLTSKRFLDWISREGPKSAPELETGTPPRSAAPPSAAKRSPELQNWVDQSKRRIDELYNIIRDPNASAAEKAKAMEEATRYLQL
jgi:hypothetical protein